MRAQAASAGKAESTNSNLCDAENRGENQGVRGKNNRREREGIIKFKCERAAQFGRLQGLQVKNLKSKNILAPLRELQGPYNASRILRSRRHAP